MKQAFSRITRFPLLGLSLLCTVPVYANHLVAYVTNNSNSGSGSFRAAIELINSNNSYGHIRFNISGQTVNVSSALPPIFNNIYGGIEIHGNNNTISGAGSSSLLFLHSGSIFVEDLTLTQGESRGGTGGPGTIDSGGGGGALGAGGAVFVNTGVSATLKNISYTNNEAVGGNGGGNVGYAGYHSGGGGGGMLNGTGGSAFPIQFGDYNGPGGGGGLGAAGGTGGAYFFFGGQQAGPGNIGMAVGQAGGGHGGTGTALGDGTGGNGGGGIGGGNGALSVGGNGGTYGGGGGNDGTGGTGGFGGGGGSGGNPGAGGFGGGAAKNGGNGLGGAIFVRSGASVTIQDSGSMSGNTVTAGSAGVGGSDGTSSGEDMYIHGGTVTFNMGSGKTFTSTRTITGGGGINKTGTGVLVLSGANGYTGGTTVSSGRLHGTTTSLQGNITNNAEVRFTSGGGTYASTLSGNGTLRKQGGSTITLSAANTYTGSTVVESGILILTSSTSSKGSATINSGATLRMNTTNAFNASRDVSATGTFDLNGRSQTIRNLSSSGSVLLGGATLTLGSTGATFSGVISEAGNVIRNGSGTVILSGANTYTGTTTSNSGTLTLNGNGIGTLHINGGSVLNFSGSSSGSANINSGTLNSTGTIAGNVTIASAGTFNTQVVNVINATSSNVVVDGNFNLNNFSQRIGDLSGAATGRIALGSGTLTFGDSANSTFSGIVSGNGHLIKNGTNTETLPGANVYTGTTTVNSGILNLTGTGLGAITVTGGSTANVTGSTPSNVIVNNGTLNFSPGSIGGNLTVTTGIVVVNSTVLGNVVMNSGTTNLTGIVQGVVTVNGGSLNYTSGASGIGGNLLIDGGTFTALNADVLTVPESLIVNTPGLFDMNNFNQTVKDFSGSGNVTLGTAVLTFGTGTNTIFSGVVNPTAGSLIKQGSGTVTFSGNSFYTNGTTISEGVLQVGVDDALPVSGNVLVPNGTTLDVNGFNQTMADLTGSGAVTLGSGTLSIGSATPFVPFSGVISGVGGSLVKNGTGVISLESVNTYNGGTTVTAGVLQGDTLGVQGNIINNSVVLFTQGAASGSYTGLMTGTGQLEIGAVGDTGIVTLTQANTYTGGTYINFGTLRIGINNAIATGTDLFISADGNLDLNGFDIDVNVASGSGTISIGSGGVFSLGDNTDFTFDSNIIGLGSLNKQGSGTVTLTGTNSYRGGTTISGGALQGAVGSLQGNILALAGTQVIFEQATDATYTDDMSGSGELVKIDTGILTLTGDNSYTGGTTVNGGSLRGHATRSIQGNITLNGTTSLLLDQSVDMQTDTYNDVISGTGTVTKLGPGTLILTGDHLYTGLTTVEEGQLTLASGANLASSVLINKGATFELSGGAVAGNITGETPVDSTSVLIISAGFSTNGIIQNVGTIQSTNGNFTITTGNVPQGFEVLSVKDSGAIHLGVMGSPLPNFTIPATASLVVSEASGSGGTVNATYGPLINEGTVTVYTNGSITGDTLTNKALINLSGGTILSPIVGEAGSSLVTSGNTQTGNTINQVETITVASGFFTIDSPITNFTTFTVDAGATALLNGVDLAIPNIVGSKLAVSGQFDMNGRSITGGADSTLELNNLFATNGVIAGVGTIEVNNKEFLINNSPTGYHTFKIGANGIVGLATNWVIPSNVIDFENKGILNMGARNIIIGGNSVVTNLGIWETSGSISGSGGTYSMTVGNGGVFTLNNPVSGYSALSIASGGTLNLNAGGSLLDAVNVVLDNGGVFNINKGASFNANINNALPATGTVNVNGNFVPSATGTINTNILNISSTGSLTLTDNPIVATTVNNMGTIIHTATTPRTIVGNFVQSGRLEMLIADDGTPSLINVIGNTTFNGGKIKVTLPGGGDSLVSGDSFDVLNTTGAFTVNQFPEVSAPLSLFFSFKPSVSGQNLRLTVARRSFESITKNPVLKGVAKGLDQLIALSETDPSVISRFPVLSVIGAQSTEEQVEDIYRQLLPHEVNGGSVAGSRLIQDAVTDKIMGRLHAFRSGAGNLLERGYVGGDVLDGQSSYGPLVFGNTARQRTRGQMAGFSAVTGGFGLLADTPIGDNFRAGVAVTYGATYVKRQDFTGNVTTVQSLQASFYGSANYENLFMDGVIMWGHNNYKGIRNIQITNQVAHSDYKGIQTGGRIEGGFSIPIVNLELAPMASLQYTRLNRLRYTEQGAPGTNLRVDARGTTIAELGLGGKITEVSEPDSFLPEMHAFYLYDIRPPKFNITTSFAGGGGAFVSNGPEPARGGINLGVGVSVFFTEDIFMNAGYDLYAKKSFVSHSASFKFRVVF